MFGSLIYIQRYALNGAPYKINLFLDGAGNFRGPESEGFVASIYNFSGSLESGSCGNCQQQKEEGALSIAQVPATVPMRHHLGESLDKEVLQPVYMAVNNFGKVSRTNPLSRLIFIGLFTQTLCSLFR